jgi:3-hydroxyisobutyrate dehydrogenase
VTVYSDTDAVNSSRVAVLGTGVMGAGMARNLAAAGLDTRVWNRTPERAEALAGDGITVCASAADAVAGAAVVVTMLWDTAAVEKVLRGAKGSFAPGAVLLQTSTVGVDGAGHLGGVAQELGLVYVDAPVLGTRQPAEQGRLVVLASGPDDVRATVTPVLDAVGARTLWVGPAGTGSRLKLAANTFVLNVNTAVAESLAVTRALGLDPQLFLDAIAGGPTESPFVHHKGEAMVTGHLDAAFALSGGLKDADLILEATREAGFEPSLLRATRSRLDASVRAGHGDLDIAAVWLDL